MWFELTGDSRLGRCASEGCGQQPAYRLEAGDIGSDYCSACRASIEALNDAHNAGIGFVMHHPDGTAERIAPWDIIEHGDPDNPGDRE